VMSLSHMSPFWVSRRGQLNRGLGGGVYKALWATAGVFGSHGVALFSWPGAVALAASCVSLLLNILLGSGAAGFSLSPRQVVMLPNTVGT